MTEHRKNNRMEELTIPARDGFPLAATLFHPPEGAGPFVLINPAFGVRRAFYSFFARYLASRGYRVLCFDYRGVGGSSGAGPETVLEPMHAWATLDIAGVQRWIESHGNEGYHLFGHSGGGWLMAYLRPSDRIRSMVFLAVPDGFWKHYPGWNRLRMAFTWRWLLPRHVKKNGMLKKGGHWYGESLPPNVTLDWARACRHPGFIEDERLEFPARFAAIYRQPTLAFTFSDDEYAPPSSVDSLLRRFPSLTLERRHLHPRDLGATEIGHFGFLKPIRKNDLWAETGDWLDRQTATIFC